MLPALEFDALTFDAKEEVYVPFILPVCSSHDSPYPWV